MGLTALYTFMAGLDSRRFVWYDELFTFDVAKAPSIRELVRLVFRWEPAPPTSYLLSRFSMNVFGQNAFGLRVPSMVAFYLGSLLLFFFLRRKIGSAYATLALLTLWWSDTFRYATEARPYALVVLFSASLLFCWDIILHNGRSGRAVWGIAGSSLGLVASHVFAPFFLSPFLMGEAVRSIRRRRVDLGVWSAMLLPLRPWCSTCR